MKDDSCTGLILIADIVVTLVCLERWSRFFHGWLPSRQDFEASLLENLYEAEERPQIFPLLDCCVDKFSEDS